MYNKDNKERFISNIDIKQFPENYWNNLFGKAAEVEEMYGKDLFNFTKKEILSFYKYLDSKSLDYLMVTNFNLIKYAQWALQETLIIDGQNHFVELVNEELADCVNKLGVDESIVTKEQFEEMLNKIHSVRDKFIMRAIFEGIKGTKYCEIINANINDINLKNKTIKLCTGRTVNISNDLIRVAEEAVAETSYISPNGREYILYGDYGIICKNVRPNMSEANQFNIINKTVRNILNKIGASRYITINSIYTSGLIHQINEFAKQDGCTPEEVVSNTERQKYLINQYGWVTNTRSRFLLRYRDQLK